MFKTMLVFFLFSVITILTASDIKKYTDSVVNISISIPPDVCFFEEDEKCSKSFKLVMVKNDVKNLVQWVLDNTHNTVGLSSLLWDFIKQNKKFTSTDLFKIYSTGQKGVLLSGDDTDVYGGIEYYIYDNKRIGEYGVILCDSELTYTGVVQELRFIKEDKIVILKLFYKDQLLNVPKSYQKYFIKSQYYPGKWEFKNSDALDRFYSEVIKKKKYKNDDLKLVVEKFSEIRNSIKL